MLYNELEQGDILSGVCCGLALLAYTDILLCSIWAIHKIRQSPGRCTIWSLVSSSIAMSLGSSSDMESTALKHLPRMYASALVAGDQSPQRRPKVWSALS